MSIGPIVIDIDDRVKDERFPPEELTVQADLTGHTVDMVIETMAGVVVDILPGSLAVTSGVTVITFPISAAAVEAAGYYRYSQIVDRASATLRETRVTGMWKVTDLPG